MFMTSYKYQIVDNISIYELLSTSKFYTVAVPSNFRNHKYYKFKIIDYEIPKAKNINNTWLCIHESLITFRQINTKVREIMDRVDFALFNLSDKNNINNFEVLIPYSQTLVFSFQNYYLCNHGSIPDSIISEGDPFLNIVFELSVDDTMK